MYEEKGALRKYTYWLQEGADTNVRYLQARVSNLVSHVSEHDSTWFGLAGARVCL
jgi:hypothetical protein